ncbi:MAG: hypothetical protein QNI90_09705 [Dinoroseobacter sp.]|nr:hypothetical protein [Dinoroseobacter sp.]
MKTILTAACIAGLFCAAFAVVVDVVSNHLTMLQTIAIAALSGFLGALVGQLTVSRKR